MTDRTGLWSAAAVGMVLVLAGEGCQKKAAPQPADPPPAAQQADAAPDVAITPNTGVEPIDTAQAMAQKAAAYSQNMSQLLNQRQMTQPSQTLVNGGGQEPSEVRWMDPDEFSLGDVSADVSTKASAEPPSSPATVTPVVDSTPSEANQLASLVPSAPKELDTAAQPASSVQPPLPITVDPRPITAGISDDSLARKFAQRVQDYPNDIAAHLDHQLLLFLNDEQVPQLSSIASLPEEDRELVTAILDGLSNFRNTVRADNNMLLSKKVQPVLQMADRLRAQADLYIPAIALCTRVDGFGSYAVIDPPRFVAGQEHPAIVYCEVANFASQLNEQKQWETRLTQEAVLYTESGLPVWQDKSKTITDTCRNRRHDFFIVKMIRLPATLTIGRYLLKVTVVDQQASRVAEATVPIQIVAQ